MAGLILGKAHTPKGMAYVEASHDKDHFFLQNMATGERRFMHRDRIEWRR